MNKISLLLLFVFLINVSQINIQAHSETLYSPKKDLNKISNYKSICQVKLLLGEFSKAKENCQKVLAIDTNDDEAIILIEKINEAENLSSKISTDNKISIDKQILNISPFNRKILLELGYELADTNKTESKNYLIKALEVGIDDENQIDYQNLAVLYSSENNFEKTIFYYDKALNASSSDSLDSLIYHKRGDIYMEKGA